MKFFENISTFNFTWDQVAIGFWNRYPNPHSTHVLSEDTISRQVIDGRLKSLRLLTKTNLSPKWGEHLISNRSVKIIEESIVDPDNKTIITYTRNIGYTKIMSITEKVVYKANPEDNSQTVAHRYAWIDSKLFGLSRPIQEFGFKRFKKNCAKAELGFLYVLEKLFPGKLPNISSPQIDQCGKLLDSAKRAKELTKTRAIVL